MEIAELNKTVERQRQEYNQLQTEIRINKNECLPREKYPEELKKWYMSKTGLFLNLDNPRTFDEKINWIKIYENDDRKRRLADKVLVRDWIEEKIGAKYLTNLYGVWKSFREIEFDKLPISFVLKTNHGSSYNLIVTDKSNLDIEAVNKMFTKWINTNFAYNLLEMHYKNIQPLIMAEEYLDNKGLPLATYKVWCFNGEPKFIKVHPNVDGVYSVKGAVYDIDWKRLPFYIVETYDGEIEKPANLEELLQISRILCEDFNMVRVDFHRLYDGNFKFSEMTFTPSAGNNLFIPEEYNKIIGDMFDI